MDINDIWVVKGFKNIFSLELVEIGGFFAEVFAFFVAGINYADNSIVGTIISLLFGFYLAFYVGHVIERRCKKNE